ncbi:hypothetical protein Dimus_034066 [Dionaea muscipula]
MGPIVEAEKSSIAEVGDSRSGNCGEALLSAGLRRGDDLGHLGFYAPTAGLGLVAPPASVCGPIVSVPTVVVGPEMVPIQVTEEPHHALVSSSASSLRVVEEPAALGPVETGGCRDDSGSVGGISKIVELEDAVANGGAGPVMPAGGQQQPGCSAFTGAVHQTPLGVIDGARVGASSEARSWGVSLGEWKEGRVRRRSGLGAKIAEHETDQQRTVHPTLSTPSRFEVLRSFGEPESEDMLSELEQEHFHVAVRVANVVLDDLGSHSNPVLCPPSGISRRRSWWRGRDRLRGRGWA